MTVAVTPCWYVQLRINNLCQLEANRMERREVMLKCLSGAALTLVPSKLLPGLATDSTSEFYEVWEEACLCHYWFEDKRAYDLCLRALTLAPEDLDNSFRADIIEKLGQLREALDAAERDLGKQREALRTRHEITFPFRPT